MTQITNETQSEMKRTGGGHERTGDDFMRQRVDRNLLIAPYNRPVTNNRSIVVE